MATTACSAESASASETSSFRVMPSAYAAARREWLNAFRFGAATPR
ncbi:MAG: hypothetical protein FWD29_01580 [Micrococcales bacterium]|nr:hypothetical protein [Micrococcales bacterium]